MLWLLLTQSSGGKVRVNIQQAAVYYADEPPKDFKGAKTVIEMDGSAFWVKETEIQIDEAVINEKSPLRLGVSAPVTGWR